MSDANTSASVMLDGLIGERTKRAVAGVNTCDVGRVESYDRNTRLASVQPLVRTRSYDVGDQVVDVNKPIVDMVPVLFPGSGPFRITWTIKPGDLVTLIYSKESLEDVVESGAMSGPYEYDPHSATDAMALAGFQPTNTPGNPTPENGLRLEIENPAGPDTFKIELDLVTMSMQLSAPNQLILTAGTQLVLEAPDVIANGLRVDSDGEWRG